MLIRIKLLKENPKMTSIELEAICLKKAWQNLALKSKKVKLEFYTNLRQTILFILSPYWLELEASLRLDLTESFRRCSEKFCGLIYKCNEISKFVLNMSEDAWSNHFFQWDAIFNGKLNADDKCVQEYLAYELDEIIVARVHFLVNSKMEKQAMNLVKCLFKYHCRILPSSSYCKSKSCIFSAKSNKSVVNRAYASLDWYLFLLQKMKSLDDISYEVSKWTCHEGIEIINRAKRNVKYKKFASLLVNILFIQELVKASNYCCTKELFVLWCEMHKDANSSLKEITEAVHKILSSFAATSAHFYLFVDSLWEQFGSRCLSLYADLYVRGLTSDINYLEAIGNSDARQERKNLETHIASMFTKLSTLFIGSHEEVARECLFSAYSLKPNKECLLKLKQLSNDLSPNNVANEKVFTSLAQDCNCGFKCMGFCRNSSKKPCITHPLLAKGIKHFSYMLIKDLVCVLEYSRCFNFQYNVFEWARNSSDLEHHLQFTCKNNLSANSLKGRFDSNEEIAMNDSLGIDSSHGHPLSITSSKRKASFDSCSEIFSLDIGANIEVNSDGIATNKVKIPKMITAIDSLRNKSDLSTSASPLTELSYLSHKKENRNNSVVHQNFNDVYESVIRKLIAKDNSDTKANDHFGSTLNSSSVTKNDTSQHMAASINEKQQNSQLKNKKSQFQANVSRSSTYSKPEMSTVNMLHPNSSSVHTFDPCLPNTSTCSSSKISVKENGFASSKMNTVMQQHQVKTYKAISETSNVKSNINNSHPHVSSNSAKNEDISLNSKITYKNYPPPFPSSVKYMSKINHVNQVNPSTQGSTLNNSEHTASMKTTSKYPEHSPHSKKLTVNEFADSICRVDNSVKRTSAYQRSNFDYRGIKLNINTSNKINVEQKPNSLTAKDIHYPVNSRGNAYVKAETSHIYKNSEKEINKEPPNIFLNNNGEECGVITSNQMAYSKQGNFIAASARKCGAEVENMKEQVHAIPHSENVPSRNTVIHHTMHHVSKIVHSSCETPEISERTKLLQSLRKNNLLHDLALCVDVAPNKIITTSATNANENHKQTYTHRNLINFNPHSKNNESESLLAFNGSKPCSSNISPLVENQAWEMSMKLSPKIVEINSAKKAQSSQQHVMQESHFMTTAATTKFESNEKVISPHVNHHQCLFNSNQILPSSSLNQTMTSHTPRTSTTHKSWYYAPHESMPSTASGNVSNFTSFVSKYSKLNTLSSKSNVDFGECRQTNPSTITVNTNTTQVPQSLNLHRQVSSPARSELYYEDSHSKNLQDSVYEALHQSPASTISNSSGSYGSHFPAVNASALSLSLAYSDASQSCVASELSTCNAAVICEDKSSPSIFVPSDSYSYVDKVNAHSLFGSHGCPLESKSSEKKSILPQQETIVQFSHLPDVARGTRNSTVEKRPSNVIHDDLSAAFLANQCETPKTSLKVLNPDFYQYFEYDLKQNPALQEYNVNFHGDEKAENTQNLLTRQVADSFVGASSKEDDSYKVNMETDFCLEDSSAEPNHSKPQKYQQENIDLIQDHRNRLEMHKISENIHNIKNGNMDRSETSFQTQVPNSYNSYNMLENVQEVGVPNLYFSDFQARNEFLEEGLSMRISELKNLSPHQSKIPNPSNSMNSYSQSGISQKTKIPKFPESHAESKDTLEKMSIYQNQISKFLDHHKQQQLQTTFGDVTSGLISNLSSSGDVFYSSKFNVKDTFDSKDDSELLSRKESFTKCCVCEKEMQTSSALKKHITECHPFLFKEGVNNRSSPLLYKTDDLNYLIASDTTDLNKMSNIALSNLEDLVVMNCDEPKPVPFNEMDMQNKRIVNSSKKKFEPDVKSKNPDNKNKIKCPTKLCVYCGKTLTSVYMKKHIQIMHKEITNKDANSHSNIDSKLMANNEYLRSLLTSNKQSIDSSINLSSIDGLKYSRGIKSDVDATNAVKLGEIKIEDDNVINKVTTFNNSYVQQATAMNTFSSISEFSGFHAFNEMVMEPQQSSLISKKSIRLKMHKQPVKCSICFKEYSSLPYLNRHIKKCHPNHPSLNVMQEKCTQMQIPLSSNPGYAKACTKYEKCFTKYDVGVKGEHNFQERKVNDATESTFSCYQNKVPLTDSDSLLETNKFNCENNFNSFSPSDQISETSDFIKSNSKCTEQINMIKIVKVCSNEKLKTQSLNACAFEPTAVKPLSGKEEHHIQGIANIADQQVCRDKNSNSYVANKNNVIGASEAYQSGCFTEEEKIQALNVFDDKRGSHKNKKNEFQFADTPNHLLKTSNNKILHSNETGDEVSISVSDVCVENENDKCEIPLAHDCESSRRADEHTLNISLQNLEKASCGKVTYSSDVTFLYKKSDQACNSKYNTNCRNKNYQSQTMNFPNVELSGMFQVATLGADSSSSVEETRKECSNTFQTAKMRLKEFNTNKCDEFLQPVNKSDVKNMKCVDYNSNDIQFILENELSITNSDNLSQSFKPATGNTDGKSDNATKINASDQFSDSSVSCGKENLAVHVAFTGKKQETRKLFNQNNDDISSYNSERTRNGKFKSNQLCEQSSYSFCGLTNGNKQFAAHNTKETKTHKSSPNYVTGGEKVKVSGDHVIEKKNIETLEDHNFKSNELQFTKSRINEGSGTDSKKFCVSNQTTNHITKKTSVDKMYNVSLNSMKKQHQTLFGHDTESKGNYVDNEKPENDCFQSLKEKHQIKANKNSKTVQIDEQSNSATNVSHSCLGYRNEKFVNGEILCSGSDYNREEIKSCVTDAVKFITVSSCEQGTSAKVSDVHLTHCDKRNEYIKLKSKELVELNDSNYTEFHESYLSNVEKSAITCNKICVVQHPIFFSLLNDLGSNDKNSSTKSENNIVDAMSNGSIVHKSKNLCINTAAVKLPIARVTECKSGDSPCKETEHELVSITSVLANSSYSNCFKGKEDSCSKTDDLETPGKELTGSIGKLSDNMHNKGAEVNDVKCFDLIKPNLKPIKRKIHSLIVNHVKYHGDKKNDIATVSDFSSCSSVEETTESKCASMDCMQKQNTASIESRVNKKKCMVCDEGEIDSHSKADNLETYEKELTKRLEELSEKKHGKVVEINNIKYFGIMEHNIAKLNKSKCKIQSCMVGNSQHEENEISSASDSNSYSPVENTPKSKYGLMDCVQQLTERSRFHKKKCMICSKVLSSEMFLRKHLKDVHNVPLLKKNVLYSKIEKTLCGGKECSSPPSLLPSPKPSKVDNIISSKKKLHSEKKLTFASDIKLEGMPPNNIRTGKGDMCPVLEDNTGYLVKKLTVLSSCTSQSKKKVCHEKSNGTMEKKNATVRKCLNKSSSHEKLPLSVNQKRRLTQLCPSAASKNKANILINSNNSLNLSSSKYYHAPKDGKKYHKLSGQKLRTCLNHGSYVKYKRHRYVIKNSLISQTLMSKPCFENSSKKSSLQLKSFSNYDQSARTSCSNVPHTDLSKDPSAHIAQRNCMPSVLTFKSNEEIAMFLSKCREPCIRLTRVDQMLGKEIENHGANQPFVKLTRLRICETCAHNNSAEIHKQNHLIDCVSSNRHVIRNKDSSNSAVDLAKYGQANKKNHSTSQMKHKVPVVTLERLEVVKGEKLNHSNTVLKTIKFNLDSECCSRIINQKDGKEHNLSQESDCYVLLEKLSL